MTVNINLGVISSFFVIENTVCTFHLNILFDEWVNKFDKDEASAGEQKNIKVLFRGFCKDNPHKAIVVVQAEEDVLGQHIQESFETFEKKWSKYEYCYSKTLNLKIPFYPI